VLQALLRTLWNWSPAWRGVGLTLLVLLLAGFAFWVSLPEERKERLLDAMFKERAAQPQPAAATPGDDTPRN
jgi:hypothetical protein